MLHTLLATATDLEQWANLLEGKSTFPELLRRLISATSPTLTSISFDSAEGTLLGGWDGLTDATLRSPYVPAGTVGWELGTNQDQKGKADDDYRKRTTDPLGLERSNSAFIFCTPRRWSQKEKWAKTRRAEGIWQDVRAYDANDFITWLTDAPATHIWLSRLLRKCPASVFDLESFWLDWATVTTPAVPTGLLLASRAKETETIQAWLTGPARTLSLLADTRKEAIATLAAMALALPEAKRVDVLAKTVVVESVDTWHELVLATRPLLLIPLFRDDEAIASAVRHGHKVFIPLDRTDAHYTAAQLPRPSREDAVKVLTEAGIPNNSADTLAGIARRSIAALRRHRLLKSLGTNAPVWANAANASVLLAAAFTGAWNENEHAAAADKEVIAMLAGQSYEQVQMTLTQLLNGPEPPVRKVGTTWYVVDKADVWTLLAHFNTPALLERLATAALQILGTPLPRYQLPADRQLFANLYGFSAPNSTQLRHEVADTLAFLGAEETAPASVKAIVRRVVSDLLARANQQPHVWSSLANYLPQLAEAAPDEFLAGISIGVKGESAPIMELFEKKKGFMYDSSEHPDLLCALELLAWHPPYLPQATRALARLAQLAPDISIHNRPDNSLREIFLPWLPHTSANSAQRMAALKAILNAIPDVGWALLLKLLPIQHTTSHHTRQPKWRDWAPVARPDGISYAVLFAALDAISICLLDHVGTDPARWESFIPNFTLVYRPQRPRLLAQFEEFVAAALLTEIQRLVLSQKLRELIHHQRSYIKREAELTPTELNQLEACYAKLLPIEPLNRYAWLFDNWPSLLSGERHKRGTDYFTKKVAIARQEAINALLREVGLTTVLELVPRVEASIALGAMLGKCDDLTSMQKDDLLLRYLGSQDIHEFDFGRGLAIEYRLTHTEPWEWAIAEVRRQQAIWSPRQQAAWLETFPDNPHTWALATELGPDTEREFWLLASPYGVKSADAAQAFAQFLSCGRPLAAAHVAHLHPDAIISTENLTVALEQVIKLPADSEPRLVMSGDELVELVAKLADNPDADPTRVARLEFALLPVQHGERHKAKFLFRELATNPVFFVDVLRMFTFSADHTDPPTATGEIAANAYQLLRAWNTIPGFSDSNTPDLNYLLSWIAEAQELATAPDRLILAEEHIGDVLSCAPVDPDGIWPHRLVRDAIEHLANENIERGISMGKRNGRGVTWRSAFAGGDQERELAAGLTVDATLLAAEWPRTAGILRNLAAGYTADAEREDEEAILHQDLG
jgi:hypothetical protein